MVSEYDVVFIGDLAFNEDRVVSNNEEVARISYGGSAYYCSIGASTVSEDLGIISRIGKDFNLNILTERGIDVRGVTTIDNLLTPRFVLTQYSDNTRDFEAQRGAAEQIDTKSIPEEYLCSKYVHLSTGLPQHHSLWIDALKSKVPKESVSADAFEAFARDYPLETLSVLNNVGLVFINEEELGILREFGNVTFEVPTILKKGSKGVAYLEADYTINIKAPKVNVIDTTGAGDVLAGTYLALRAKNVPVIGALEQAVKTATKSVMEFGVDHLNPLI